MRDPRNWVRPVAAAARRHRRRRRRSCSCAPRQRASARRPKTALDVAERAAARRGGRGAQARCDDADPTRGRVSRAPCPVADGRRPGSPARARRRGSDAARAARATRAAFEVIYDRHCTRGLLARLPDVRARAAPPRTSSRRPSSRSGARGARYDRARGSVRTWVLGIVHNRAIDALRRSTVHDTPARERRGHRGALRGRASAPTSRSARRDEAREVRGALDELPDEQQQVIELAYFGGFTHTEIAEMLDTPIGTVKGRMRLGPREAARAARRAGQRRHAT